MRGRIPNIVEFFAKFEFNQVMLSSHQAVKDMKDHLQKVWGQNILSAPKYEFFFLQAKKIDKI